MKKAYYFYSTKKNVNETGGGYTFSENFLKVLKNLPIEIISVPTEIGDFNNINVDLNFIFKARKVVRSNFKADYYFFSHPFSLFWSLPKPKIASIFMFHGTIKESIIKSLNIRHPRVLFFNLIYKIPFVLTAEKMIFNSFKRNKKLIPIFNSLYTTKNISRLYDINENIFEENVAYLPVDTSLFLFSKTNRNEIRKKFNILDKEILVIYLSNFADVKRIDLAYSISKKVIARNKNIKFLFVGRKIDKDCLWIEKEIKGKYSQNIFFVGEIKPEEVKEYFSAADIAIHTSAHETFGYSIVEAMSVGLPVVAYSTGAIPEVIKDKENGFLVEDKNEKEFVSVLESLIKSESLRKIIGGKARNRAEDFSIKNYSYNLLKTLNKNGIII